MFGDIAARYDLLNHLLSGNVDRSWRKSCVKVVAERLQAERPRILDVGCGTGDLAMAFASKKGSTVGCDFCRPMLQRAKEKVLRNPGSRIDLVEGDALSVPFREGTFDAVVSAFVLRNLANLSDGVKEMWRVLRPGGVLGILEFAMPRNSLYGNLYRFYFTQLLPRVGRVVSGVDGPYRYLPESVQSFPPPDDLRELIAGVGFESLQLRFLTGGIVLLVTATK